MNNKNINAMRSLSLQAIKNSNEGHTGMAISSAPINYVIYTSFLNIEKSNPKWINRDRFILSAGHGSISLYSIFYFSGILSLKDIKEFRKGNVLTAGHPENTSNNFVDASTGPLGQGLANGVGMAIAEKYLSNKWKKLKGIIDHYTYVVVGDGDIQEGVSYESMSLAGKLKLNKLIVLHDSNDFQIDSKVTLVNNEKLRMRFNSQNWFYQICDNNPESIASCIMKAKESKKPNYIEIKTIIGEGTSKSNHNSAHGLKITDEEIVLTNKHFAMDFDNWNFDESIFSYFNENVIKRGNKKYGEWQELYSKYKNKYPKLIDEFENDVSNNFDKIEKLINIDCIQKNNQSTKTYLKDILDCLSKNNISNLLTLSADLAATTNCKNSECCFNNDSKSPYILIGIREFAMSCIQNGILLHGGLKSISGTFLAFSDYMKSSIRIGAMSNLGSIYIFTHDSYLVGGDGPTHQPYDQIPMLRAIENVYVHRPADEKEMIGIFKNIINDKKRTHCLLLSRQELSSNNNTDVLKVSNGAYVVKDAINPDITIIANGSELSLAIEACDYIKESLNIDIKVVSCPSLKIFLEQEEKYIRDVINSSYGTIALEASSDFMWHALSEYTNKKIKLISATTFGISNEGKKVYASKGFNKENILKKSKELINEQNY